MPRTLTLPKAIPATPTSESTVLAYATGFVLGRVVSQLVMGMEGTCFPPSAPVRI